MDKPSVIRALQAALAESIDLIKHLTKKHGDEDPVVKHAQEQLQQILTLSAYVQDESRREKHALYDN